MTRKGGGRDRCGACGQFVGSKGCGHDPAWASEVEFTQGGGRESGTETRVLGSKPGSEERAEATTTTTAANPAARCRCWRGCEVHGSVGDARERIRKLEAELALQKALHARDERSLSAQRE